MLTLLENFGILGFPGRFWCNFRLCCCLNQLGALRLCLQYKSMHGVISLHYSRPTHIHWDQESIRDLVLMRIQIAILCSLISIPLCIFSAQFAIDNNTFGTDNFQARLYWWGHCTCVDSCTYMWGVPMYALMICSVSTGTGRVTVWPDQFHAVCACCLCMCVVRGCRLASWRHVLALFPGLPTIQFLITCKYAKMEGKGLIHFISWLTSISVYLSRQREGRGPRMKE